MDTKKMNPKEVKTTQAQQARQAAKQHAAWKRKLYPAVEKLFGLKLGRLYGVNLDYNGLDPKVNRPPLVQLAVELRPGDILKLDRVFKEAGIPMEQEYHNAIRKAERNNLRDEWRQLVAKR